jgi:hypothetical protein
MQGITLATLVKYTIKEGDFEKNSDITVHGLGIHGGARKKGGRWLRSKSGKEIIKGKGSDHPLIDTGTMKNSIGAVTLRDGVSISANKAK